MLRLIFCFIFLSFWATQSAPAHQISDLWLKRIARHEFPEGHPIKKKLDRMFLAGRVIKDSKTLKNAGFKAKDPAKVTQMILASHPKLQGVLLKLYRDDQVDAINRPEYHQWVARANGANLIRDYLDSHQLWSIFKVPKKWIYIIPTDQFRPSGPNYKPRDTILVVQDMNILSKHKNQKMWGSNAVTTALVNDLYTLILTLGLWDSTKPDNIPFSSDGKIAFVDTQGHSMWPITFHKLTPFLPSEMRNLWNRLTTFNRKPT